VQDNGTGMDEDTKRRAFEPLFTTKPDGKGTGLGLPMVLGLMRQHEGAVNLESRPGHGTRFELYFRAAPATEAAAPAPAPEVPAPRPAAAGSPTLLVTDDDPAVRRSLKRALERFGYRVLTAADGAEALATLDERNGDIDLVISDSNMPRMTGPELYRTLRASGRLVRFLSTSGAPIEEPTGESDPRWRTLPKPWTLEELVGAVQELLAA